MGMVEIKVVEPTNEDLLYLIGKLDVELMERYPVEEIHGLNFNDPKINEIVFVVAYFNDLPVGCSAIRPLDTEYTELKRFFVDIQYRKMGIATKILSFIEERARELDFKVIRLETGAEQPESIQLYKKYGYVEIEKFGEYADYETSLCYEKMLGTM